MGAHVVAADAAAFYPQNPDTLISGINVVITGVTNNNAGSAPVVAFTLLDNNKNPIALSALGSLAFTMAGPTTDFGYTIFGTNTSTPGYVTESALTAAKCDTNGNCNVFFHQCDSRQVGGNLCHWCRGAAYGDGAGWNHVVAACGVWGV
jgi:hypothetical protein